MFEISEAAKYWQKQARIDDRIIRERRYELRWRWWKRRGREFATHRLTVAGSYRNDKPIWVDFFDAAKKERSSLDFVALP